MSVHVSPTRNDLDSTDEATVGKKKKKKGRPAKVKGKKSEADYAVAEQAAAADPKSPSVESVAKEEIDYINNVISGVTETMEQKER